MMCARKQRHRAIQQKRPSGAEKLQRVSPSYSQRVPYCYQQTHTKHTKALKTSQHARRPLRTPWPTDPNMQIYTSKAPDNHAAPERATTQCNTCPRGRYVNGILFLYIGKWMNSNIVVKIASKRDLSEFMKHMPCSHQQRMWPCLKKTQTATSTAKSFVWIMRAEYYEQDTSMPSNIGHENTQDQMLFCALGL